VLKRKKAATPKPKAIARKDARPFLEAALSGSLGEAMAKLVRDLVRKEIQRRKRAGS
jgi:hypothetical protein